MEKGGGVGSGGKHVSSTAGPPEKRYNGLPEFLNCIVCKNLKVTTNVKLLPCYHVICSSECYDILKFEKDLEEKDKTCIVCRRNFKDNEILPNDFLISFLKRESQSNPKGFENEICTYCTRNQKAERWCKSCKCFLCSICVDYHKFTVITSDHELVDKTKGESTNKFPEFEVSNCLLHDEEEIKLFCEECNVDFCSNDNHPEHSGHKEKIKSISSIAEGFKSQITKETLGKIKNCCKIAQKGEDLAKDKYDSLRLEKRKKLHKEFNEYFMKIIYKILDKQLEVTKYIDEKIQDEMKSAFSKGELYRLYKKQINQVKDFMELLLSQGKAWEFYIYKKTLDKHEELLVNEINFVQDAEKLLQIEHELMPDPSAFTSILEMVDKIGNIDTKIPWIKDNSISDASDISENSAQVTSTTSSGQPSKKIVMRFRKEKNNIDKGDIFISEIGTSGANNMNLLEVEVEEEENADDSKEEKKEETPRLSGVARRKQSLNKPATEDKELIEPVFEMEEDSDIEEANSLMPRKRKKIDERRYLPIIKPEREKPILSTPLKLNKSADNSEASSSKKTGPSSAVTPVTPIGPIRPKQESSGANKDAIDANLRRSMRKVQKDDERDVDSSSSSTAATPVLLKGKNKSKRFYLGKPDENKKEGKHHHRPSIGTPKKKLKMEKVQFQVKKETIMEPNFPMLQNEKMKISNADENEDYCAVCLDGGDELLICCDLCPKVFHIFCHIPALEAVPLGDFQCMFCTPKEKEKIFAQFEAYNIELGKTPVEERKEIRKQIMPRETYMVLCKFMCEIFKIEESLSVRGFFERKFETTFNCTPCHLSYIRNRLALADPEPLIDEVETIKLLKKMIYQAKSLCFKKGSLEYEAVRTLEPKLNKQIEYFYPEYKDFKYEPDEEDKTIKNQSLENKETPKKP